MYALNAAHRYMYDPYKSSGVLPLASLRFSLTLSFRRISIMEARLYSCAHHIGPRPSSLRTCAAPGLALTTSLNSSTRSWEINSQRWLVSSLFSQASLNISISSSVSFFGFSLLGFDGSFLGAACFFLSPPPLSRKGMWNVFVSHLPSHFHDKRNKTYIRFSMYCFWYSESSPPFTLKSSNCLKSLFCARIFVSAGGYCPGQNHPPPSHFLLLITHSLLSFETLRTLKIRTLPYLLW